MTNSVPFLQKILKRKLKLPLRDGNYGELQKMMFHATLSKIFYEIGSGGWTQFYFEVSVLEG